MAALIPSLGGAWAQGDLVQVHQDFTSDPGWDGVNNRVVGENRPLVTQDFGWSATSHCGGSEGEIGGTIFQSRTPAWYGMALNRPLSLRDELSASGRIAILPVPGSEASGAAYFGFLNSARQEWRPWNSVAIRISYEGGAALGAATGQHPPEGESAMFVLDYMTAAWNGGGAESDLFVPADGRPHTWRFLYDPGATPPQKWPDARLQSYLSAERQTPEQILEKAKQVEPGVTLGEIQGRLSDAVAQGLATYFRRQASDLYTINEDSEHAAGRISLEIDDGQPFTCWVPAACHDAPMAMDRFGIFNMQVYHLVARFFISDLTVNGTEIDLSRDPGWQGKGNRVQFVETDFQRQDFGHSETNWAGSRTGEIGGLFYRTEPEDPIHGYYADEVGRLTLDDPISFSGNICFVNGGTDAGMFFGYFNAQEKMKPITDPRAGSPLDDMIGIVVDGPTRIGYYFTALCSPKREVASEKNGPVFLPTAATHPFTFSYDPQANGGVGRITVTLDQETFALDLTPEQRAAGAVFDRFGLANVRAGGKYVTLYLDDLTYTARRPAGYRPVRHEQQVTTVPYPRGGRKY
jgi:hypothetical protein